MLAASPPPEAPVAIGADGAVIQIYTSGTTGQPKGVTVPIRWLASTAAYMDLGLYVTDDDVYWNAADPGWAYGLYYAPHFGPMAVGRANIMLRAGFAPNLTWNVMREFGVTNFAAAPTIYRALRTVDVPARPRSCAVARVPASPSKPM